MTEIEYIVIALLFAISLAVLIHLLRVADATRRCDMITDDIAGCCSSLGFIGCSVICSGVTRLEHIEELLGQEYDRYEVIITLDAEQYPDEFRRIISHYRMIRVNCTPSEELPAASIRALYRSRQRSYRRLIVVERALSDIYSDLDAATVVASYNYLLPAGADTHLCDKAIESIAIALSEDNAYNIQLLYSATTDSYIFRRDAVICNGGFSLHILRQIPSSAHLCIYTPLTISTKPHNSVLPSVAIVAAILSLVYSLTGLIATAATAATILFIIASARYISRLSSPANCSHRTMLCYFRKIGNIFRCRKFLIS